MGSNEFKEDTNEYALNVFVMSDYKLDNNFYSKYFNIIVPSQRINSNYNDDDDFPVYPYPFCWKISFIDCGVFQSEQNENKFDRLLSLIQLKAKLNDTKLKYHNLIVCFISNEASSLKITLISKISSLYSHYHPPIILCTQDYQNLEILIKHTYTFTYDKKMISYIPPSRDILMNEIMTRLCNFSQYQEPTTLIPIFNDNSMPNLFTLYNNNIYTTNILNENLSTKYRHTVNIMVVGRPGVGKSSLINAMLGENRSKEGMGQCVTNKLKLFMHKSINLAIYDTPGFEDKKGNEIIMNYISDFNKLGFLTSKNSINYTVHMILFLINASTRTLLDGDEEFIKFCIEYKIPIMFVITHCEWESRSKEVEQIFLKDLKKIDKSLDDRIVCLQLKNESNIKIESFGFCELMQKISKFLKSKKHVSREFFLGNINIDENIFIEGEAFAEKIVNYFREKKIGKITDKEEIILLQKWEYAHKWLIKAIGCGFGIDMKIDMIYRIYSNWIKSRKKSLDSLQKKTVDYLKTYIKNEETFEKYWKRMEREYDEGINAIKDIILINEAAQK